MAGNWIQRMHMKKGAFTAKAKAHGESVGEFANQVLKEGSNASTQTKRQASLAKTLRGLRHVKSGGK